MATAGTAVEAEKNGAYGIEQVTSSNEHLIQGYEPKTDEAKALDKRVNLKLDLVVVLILAIDFILCGIDKTNIGYVATTSKLYNYWSALLFLNPTRYAKGHPSQTR